MNGIEFKRPYSNEDLQPQPDWEYFAGVAQKHPAVKVFYEVMRPDPTTSGHIEAMEHLVWGMGEHNPLTSALYDIRKADPRFDKEIIDYLGEIAAFRERETIFKEFTRDHFAPKTAELSLRILNVVGNRSSVRKVDNYWLYYTKAYQQVKTERGERPAYNNGQSQTEWDAEVLRKTLLNEIWDEPPETNMEEQKKELIKQIGQLREDIIRGTILDFFDVAEIRIGLKAIEEDRSYSKPGDIDYFTETAPLSKEQFMQLRIVPDQSDRGWNEFKFTNKDGNPVHLAVFAPGTQRYIPFDDLEHDLNMAVEKGTGSRFSHKDWYKVNLIRSGQERYLKLIKYYLETGNYPDLTKRINSLFTNPIDSVGGWGNGGLVHNIMLGPSWGSYHSIAYYIGIFDDPFYFERRDIEGIQNGKPRLLDTIPPQLLVKTQFNQSESTGRYEFGSLPDESRPSIISEEEYDRMQKRKILQISFAEHINHMDVRYLHYPTLNSLETQSFESTQLSDQISDIFISSSRDFIAEGEYLRIPLPLNGDITQIALSSPGGEPLKIGSDFEIVKNKTGHLAIHILDPKHYDKSFYFSIGTTLSKGAQEISTELDCKALINTSSQLRSNGYIKLADSLSKLALQTNPTLIDFTRVAKGASLYTFNTKYRYRGYEPTELRRLAGFLEMDGALHIQCDGASAITNEIFEQYNRYVTLENKIEVSSGNCVNVSGIFVTEADLHAVNHIYKDGKIFETIDTTPDVMDQAHFSPNSTNKTINGTVPEDIPTDTTGGEQKDIEVIEKNKLQEIKKDLISTLERAFPNGIPASPDRSDPLFVLATKIRNYENSSDLNNFERIIDSISQSKNSLNRFLAKAIESKTLLKIYPHYSDPVVSGKINDLLSGFMEVVQTKLSHPGPLKVSSSLIYNAKHRMQTRHPELLELPRISRSKEAQLYLKLAEDRINAGKYEEGIQYGLRSLNSARSDRNISEAVQLLYKSEAYRLKSTSQDISGEVIKKNINEYIKTGCPLIKTRKKDKAKIAINSL